MEQASPYLGSEDLKIKWQKNKEYADRLIDEGGVSTDLFTAALGAENTRRFFHEVFFGADCYRPLDLGGISIFLSNEDADGKTNHEKIIENRALSAESLQQISQRATRIPIRTLRLANIPRE